MAPELHRVAPERIKWPPRRAGSLPSAENDSRTAPGRSRAQKMAPAPRRVAPERRKWFSHRTGSLPSAGNGPRAAPGRSRAQKMAPAPRRVAPERRKWLPHRAVSLPSAENGPRAGIFTDHRLQITPSVTDPLNHYSLSCLFSSYSLCYLLLLIFSVSLCPKFLSYSFLSLFLLSSSLSSNIPHLPERDGHGDHGGGLGLEDTVAEGGEREAAVGQEVQLGGRPAALAAYGER